MMRAPLAWLYRVTIGFAVLLAGSVAVAPLVAPAAESSQDWPRIASLFGHDPVMRRTALASAIGLVVTAGVCFRPTGPSRRPAPRSPKLPPPPSNVVGA
jgi:hypothetical protein